MFAADLSLEDWTHGADMDFQPVFPDEFAVNETFSSGFVPAKPEEVQQGSNSILNRTTSGMTLEEAYVAFDLRESYLQRHASPMAMQADSTELNMKDFKTKSCNVWKTDDMSLFPQEVTSCANSENIYQEKVSKHSNLNQIYFPIRTTSGEYERSFN